MRNSEGRKTVADCLFPNYLLGGEIKEARVFRQEIRKVIKKVAGMTTDKDKYLKAIAAEALEEEADKLKDMEDDLDRREIWSPGSMTEPLKFFKVDHSTIYHDGFLYSFHRDLDTPKSSADQIQLRQSFHCALTEEEKCRSRCHVTGNWEMDKKGRKFMLGIVKKGDHTHGQEYRDTTPKLRFYRNDDESIHRNGFNYTFNRELDPPKQIADFQWHQTYRCAMSDQKNCQARIYSTGQWERNKHELQYQLGIFKNCIHSHALDRDSNEEDKENNIEYNIMAPASSSIHTKDLGPEAGLKFYKYMDKKVHRDGFTYFFFGNLKNRPPWKQRMRCTRKGEVTKKSQCNGRIWTTGEWETDNRGRLYQRGILKGGHSHKAFEHFFDEDETAFVGNGGPIDDKQSLDEDDVVMIED
ncbi:hypothetical protein Ddc_14656 [Ditylenchus destructor]|nr:hypothetical protein Ddc_14656 [Ditylenchus destructor]